MLCEIWFYTLETGFGSLGPQERTASIFRKRRSPNGLEARRRRYAVLVHLHMQDRRQFRRPCGRKGFWKIRRALVRRAIAAESARKHSKIWVLQVRRDHAAWKRRGSKMACFG